MKAPGPGLTRYLRALWVAAAIHHCTPCAAIERLPETVRIAAYNVENFLWQEALQPDGSLSKTFKKADSITELVRIMVRLDADILLLSEIGTEEDLNELQSHLSGSGLEYTHRVHLAGADPVRHLALLSRWPVIADRSRALVDFPIAGTREFLRRGILDAELEVAESMRLRVIGVHLKSRIESPLEVELLRRHEAHLVRQHVDALLAENPDTLLAVAGDLNGLINEPAVRAISGVRGTTGHLNALQLEDGLGDRWTHHWAEADLYSRIDYILVNAPLRRALAGDSHGILRDPAWRTASDHRPVWADFHLPAP